MSYRFVSPVVLLLTLGILTWGSARADSTSGNPVKWQQPPDLSPAGLDISATFTNLLADDFPCTRTGPITNVQIWGSWKGEMTPDPQQAAGVAFVLSVHADVPADDPGNQLGYSYPGELLWQRHFPAGTFSVNLAAAPVDEGWYDPVSGEYLPIGDHVCWQYSFGIDPTNAFVQQGSAQATNVYWLGVQAYPVYAGDAFGWKTSPSHWNDDAVWARGQEPYPGPWNELRYPANHALHPQSVALAFELTTGAGTTNGPAGTIVITNAYSTVMGGCIILSVGTAGVGTQYLQRATDLGDGSWSNVMMKPAPHPAPLTNTWHRAGPLEQVEFYRIFEP